MPSEATPTLKISKIRPRIYTVEPPVQIYTPHTHTHTRPVR